MTILLWFQNHTFILLYSLIALEFALSRWKDRRLYRLHETLSNLACRVLIGLVLRVFSLGFFFEAYSHIVHRVTPLDLSDYPILSFAGALFLLDLTYYAWHRLSHRTALLWANHSVHHQAETLNLSAGLRDAVIDQFTSIPLALTPAFLGVDVRIYGFAASLSYIYQVLTHTQLLGKLGWLEKILITPSHHRVHHGCNPQYIDRNFGGVFVFWDRLFGTFEPEVEPPVFGTLKQVPSCNPYWINLAPWVDVFKKSARCSRAIDRFKAWLAPPDWVPNGAEPEPRLSTAQLIDRGRFEPGLGASHASWLILQVSALSVLVYVLERRSSFGIPSDSVIPAAAAGLLVLLSFSAQRRAAQGRSIPVARISAISSR